MRRKISRFFAGILAAALVISSGSGAVSARGTDRAVMWSAREAEDYIRTLKSFYTEKTKEQVGSMEEEDLRSYIASIAAKKK